MNEPVDLEALYHVTEVAEFLNETIKMSPDQFRTVLHEMTANRAVVEAMSELMEEVRDMAAKVTAERNAARTALMRIVDEFGDYDALLQSREICDDRIEKLRNVRAMYAELMTEKYLPDRLNNAAFSMAVKMLGQVLDGALVDPERDRLLEAAAKLCPHTTWVFAHSATHPDGNVQVCGACGIERDKADHDNGSAAITRKAYLRKMGLVE